MIVRALEAHCRALSLPFDRSWAPAIEQHLTLLERWAPRVNLTTVANPEDALVRHVVDSLSLLALRAVREATAAIDLGSGAGFPGLPLALALPHLQMSLVEPRRKRGAFRQA